MESGATLGTGIDNVAILLPCYTSIVRMFTFIDWGASRMCRLALVGLDKVSSSTGAMWYRSEVLSHSIEPTAVQVVNAV